VVLQLTLNQGRPSKHKDLMLRRLRVFNPYNVHVMSMITKLVVYVAQIDPSGDLLAKYIGRAMKKVSIFSFQDIQRILRAIMLATSEGQPEKPEIAELLVSSIAPLLERIRHLLRDSPEYECLIGIELLAPYIYDNPAVSSE
jgi:hypothetical protein